MHILLVEDEPLVAMLLEDFLEDRGHTSQHVDTSFGAIALLAEGATFDCAILDVNLKYGDTSYSVADQLAVKKIPYIFATGDHDIDYRYRDNTAAVLHKPFDNSTLGQALAKAES